MNPEDPRSVRTDDALSAAIHRLAALKPVEDLTVNEVCAESGVSRATFYRRARTPGDLLSAEFAEILRVGFEEYGGIQREAHGAILLLRHREMLEQLAGHLSQYSELYRNSFGVDHSVMGLTLRHAMLQTLRNFLDDRREEIALPRALSTQPWEVTREVLAHNYADGMMGLFKIWLDLPEADRNPDTLTEWMLALTPSWNRRLMDMGGGRI